MTDHFYARVLHTTASLDIQIKCAGIIN